MNYEYRNASRPEYFDGVETLEELFEQYDGLTGEIAASHETAFVPITTAHDEAFATEARNPGTRDVDATMEATYNGVHEAVELTSVLTYNVIQEAGEKAASMLTAGDAQTLAEVADATAFYGADSYYVNLLLKKASTPAARRAMEVYLDAGTFVAVQQNADLYGAGSYRSEQALKQASSTNVRLAIRAALDGKVLATVEENAGLYGAGSSRASQALEGASSATVRSAMRASLDDIVLNAATESAQIYGAQSYHVSEALKGASTASVRRVFATRLSTATNRGGTPKLVTGSKAKATSGQDMRHLQMVSILMSLCAICFVTVVLAAKADLAAVVAVSVSVASVKSALVMNAQKLLASNQTGMQRLSR